MAFTAFPEQEKFPEGHAFAEKRHLFPEDERLRRHGFKILSRRGNKEAVWTRSGEEFTHSQANALVDESMRSVMR